MNDTTIGITGSAGFIGKHLSLRVAQIEGVKVLACPRAAFDSPALLQDFVSQCDTIIHVAGMNRGEEAEIHSVNVGLARKLAEALTKTASKTHVVYTSSTQEEADNVYGRAKREAGEILARWAESTGNALSILVIPNVYGAGCRPFYNSVVATFCHQLGRGETPTIQVDKELELICVRDLVEAIVEVVKTPPAGVERKRIPGPERTTVSSLLQTLKSFRDAYFETNVVPELSDRTTQNLYTTFLSYLPSEDLRHRPQLHTDNRGSLVEVIKLAHGGQVFFSTTKPGIVRGNHYHTRKVEWFCVLKGEAIIRLRRMGTEDVQEFPVAGSQPEFISIPVMHTHHIENVGNEELLTMFWCNEIFDARDADTYFEKVA